MQPHNATMAQPVMETPPAVITTKDSMYLKDAMSWMLLAAKKCAHYAKECTDPSARQTIEQMGQMHERHYTRLLSHCSTNNNQAMQGVPSPQTH